MTKQQIEIALIEKTILAILGGMVATHNVDDVLFIIDNLANRREYLKHYFDSLKTKIPEIQMSLKKQRKSRQLLVVDNSE